MFVIFKYQIGLLLVIVGGRRKQKLPTELRSYVEAEKQGRQLYIVNG